jgi:hypothetical protein
MKKNQMGNRNSLDWLLGILKLPYNGHSIPSGYYTFASIYFLLKCASVLHSVDWEVKINPQSLHF